MRIPIDRHSAVPLFNQIENFLRRQIEGGRLAPGTRLPASRALAADLGVSRLTVSNAYAELEAEGLIYGRRGAGTYVAASWPANQLPDQPPSGAWPAWQAQLPQWPHLDTGNEFSQQLAACSHPDLIQFTDGMGARALFNADDFRRRVQTVLREQGTDALGYGAAGGHPPLRETIAHILASQGIPARADNVLITTGSQQAITLTARLLLQPGSVVAVENPTYQSALAIFASQGARIVGVPVDENGMDVDALETVLRTEHPRLIYAIPTFHNPTGTSLSGRRRRRLVSLAEHYNVPILEDDFVGDLRYDGRAQPALKALDRSGSVLYANTFSKVLVPGLRVGFLVANGPVAARLRELKTISDRSTSDLLQRALQAYISVGRYQSHLRKVCNVYRRRRDAMVNALSDFLPAATWQTPQGGLFIWVRLPVGVDGHTLFPHALAHGVAFSPGALYFVDRPDERAIRLNFSVHEPARIREGIRRLAAAIAAID